MRVEPDHARSASRVASWGETRVGVGNHHKPSFPGLVLIQDRVIPSQLLGIQQRSHFAPPAAAILARGSCLALSISRRTASASKDSVIGSCLLLAIALTALKMNSSRFMSPPA